MRAASQPAADHGVLVCPVACFLIMSTSALTCFKNASSPALDRVRLQARSAPCTAASQPTKSMRVRGSGRRGCGRFPAQLALGLNWEVRSCSTCRNPRTATPRATAMSTEAKASRDALSFFLASAASRRAVSISAASPLTFGFHTRPEELGLQRGKLIVMRAAAHSRATARRAPA